MTSTMTVQLLYKCVSPLKAAYWGSFCSVLKQSYLIKGTVHTPPKLAVISHLQPHEGKQSDTVLHLREILQWGPTNMSTLSLLALVSYLFSRRLKRWSSHIWKQPLLWLQTFAPPPTPQKNTHAEKTAKPFVSLQLIKLLPNQDTIHNVFFF